MSGPRERITRRQEQAIASLLACSTLTDASVACGVAESTLRRWLRNEAFSRRYRQERALMLGGTITLLSQKCAGAVGTLASIADDREAPAGARVSAARALIELRLKGGVQDDLEERVAELEELAREKSC
jgi:hypothetical protein